MLENYFKFYTVWHITKYDFRIYFRIKGVPLVGKHDFVFFEGVYLKTTLEQKFEQINVESNNWSAKIKK